MIKNYFFLLRAIKLQAIVDYCYHKKGIQKLHQFDFFSAETLLKNIGIIKRVDDFLYKRKKNDIKKLIAKTSKGFHFEQAEEEPQKLPFKIIDRKL